ncbi:MAG TPA: hypothetical protein VI451_00510 [Anaerolineales bacterium]|nr:hypothetical protein [Anaerolineales bacterium]
MGRFDDGGFRAGVAERGKPVGVLGGASAGIYNKVSDQGWGDGFTYG